MVRNYTRKTERAEISEEAVKKAVGEVLNGGGYRKTAEIAEKYGLKKSMLHKRVKLAKINRQNNNNEITGGGDSGISDNEELITTKVIGKNKFQGRKVFTDEEEVKLSEYLIKAANIHYGLTYKLTRRLAYEYATKLNKYPPKWAANSQWMLSYMKRHPELSLRVPENTSKARSVAFNEVNVNLFFDNYCQVLDKYKFLPSRIINMDETAIKTVMPPPKVIAQCGKKQVGTITSQERGELVTCCGIITASGSSLPPVYIFPRVRYKDSFLNGAPSESLGLSNRSGWMTSELFLEVLKHIKRQTSSSKDYPILVLMDNHKAYVSLEAIYYAKDNGISLLSFPPHCSHRLQPLDVGVFGPFKNYLKISIADWMRIHPERAVTIHDVAQISALPFQEAFSAKNILASFKKPGIWPLNRLAFSKDDYAAASVTEKPLVGLQPSVSQTTDDQQSFISPSSSNLTDSLSPEDCWPLQKTGHLRKEKETTRPKARSTIYTSTPEKRNLEILAQEKMKSKPIKRKLLFDKMIESRKKQRVSSSSEESEVDMVLLSEDEGWISIEEEEEGEQTNESNVKLLTDEVISKNDYVLVKFTTKIKIIHYIGQVTSETNKDRQSVFTVNFMRRKGEKFHFPAEPDISSVYRSEIVAKLPEPISSGRSKRTQGILTFNINFDGFEIN